MLLVSLRFPDFPLASVFPFHAQPFEICTDSPNRQMSRVLRGRIHQRVVVLELRAAGIEVLADLLSSLKRAVLLMLACLAFFQQALTLAVSLCVSSPRGRHQDKR
jgi:hypothetical protein